MHSGTFNATLHSVEICTMPKWVKREWPRWSLLMITASLWEIVLFHHLLLSPISQHSVWR